MGSVNLPTIQNLSWWIPHSVQYFPVLLQAKQQFTVKHIKLPSLLKLIFMILRRRITLPCTQVTAEKNSNKKMVIKISLAFC